MYALTDGGKWEDALDLYRKRIVRLQESGSKGDIVWAHYNLAVMLLELERDKEAL